MAKIGFVGLGIMGRPMALNLIKAGHTLTVFNRTASKAKPLTDAGATAAATPAGAAEGADITVTIVSDTPDVEQVILGPDGVIEGARPDSVVIDMSTISPVATEEIAKKLDAKGIHALDAPVSGGDKGAIEGTLSIMVGGQKDIFDRCLPVFEAMGKNVVYCRGHGTGQSTKLCNQIVGAINILAVCEGLVLAKKSGLDLHTMLKAIGGGAAGSWMVSNLGPKMADRDWAPGFMIHLQQKDLRLVMEAADQLQLSLPGTALAHQILNAAEQHGWGEEGTQAMAKVLDLLTP